MVIPPASRRFGSINVGLVGPLPESEGCRYLLTLIDRFSRWPEVILIPDISSKTCCTAFIRHWLPRYGVPDKITTDRGSQFVGGVWAELMNSLGIKSSSTTAYHPQSNGLRFTDASWQESLPLVLLGLRSS